MVFEHECVNINTTPSPLIDLPRLLDEVELEIYTSIKTDYLKCHLRARF